MFVLAEGSLLREDGACRMLRGIAQPWFCGKGPCHLQLAARGLFPLSPSPPCRQGDRRGVPLGGSDRAAGKEFASLPRLVLFAALLSLAVQKPVLKKKTKKKQIKRGEAGIAGFKIRAGAAGPAERCQGGVFFATVIVP